MLLPGEERTILEVSQGGGEQNNKFTAHIFSSFVQAAQQRASGAADKIICQIGARVAATNKCLR
jgi:hypothetical protein